MNLEKTIDSNTRWTVLPFYATGALFFLLLVVLMIMSQDALTGHYFNPPIIAIAHTAALGWGTMLIFGAAYQLLPVIYERRLYSSRLAFASYILLLLGTTLLIYTFWHFQVGHLMICAGLLIVLSSVCYAVNVMRTAAKPKASAPEQLFLISSALWLLVTTIIGLLLAINLWHNFIPRNHLEILKLHAHAGLAGWFLQLITGVSIKLVPMFLMGRSHKTKLISVAFILQNLGLLMFLIDGYFFPIQIRSFYYLFIVSIGIACWMIYLIDLYRKRLRKKTEMLMRQTGLSFLALILAIAALPMAYYGSDPKWTALYGMLLFLGWITAIILGQTFKTLPFIVWKMHYGKSGARTGLPLPKELYSESAITCQYYYYIAAMLVLGTGIMLNHPAIIQVAMGLWLLLAVQYVFQVFRIIFHKPKATSNPKHGNIPN